ncbi:MAG: tetratricopeptide repeat protein [Deltaproteobacteria bacterium]|nr:tetratricopeptide repeat protein [Deltaproteobacteria bacterium]
MTRAQRNKAQAHKAPPRRMQGLTALPGSGPVRMDLPGGNWIVNVGAWQALLDDGTDQLEAGDFDQAVQTLTKALKSAPAGTPMRSRALWALGTAWAQLEKYDVAYPLHKEAVALEPQRPEYWHNLAMTCLGRHYPVEAEAAWHKCLAVEPGADLRRMALDGLCEVESGRAMRIAASPGLTVEAIRAHEPVFRAGLDAIDRHDFAAAMALFQQSAALDNCHRQSWANLGVALMASGRLDESEVALRRALQIDPAYAFAQSRMRVLEELRLAAPGVGEGGEAGALGRVG